MACPYALRDWIEVRLLSTTVFECSSSGSVSDGTLLLERLRVLDFMDAASGTAPNIV